MGQFLLAIDQGTTGSTVLVLDEKLAVCGRGYSEFAQHFPEPGWVEHNPEEIWQSVLSALKEAVYGAGNTRYFEPSEIAAIGITNQRETTVVWDRKTGQALAPAIVWQDRRTADFCHQLRERGLSDKVKQLTGLVLDPYFSGTKLRWLLENVSGLLSRAGKGEVCFGTIDSYLVWRLTGGAAHVTDVSNASRTLLFDINERRWSPFLTELFNVPEKMLPRVCASAETVGTSKNIAGIPDGVPIAGIAGDQQAALFGQACFAPGEAKCTYGTGAFLLLNTGDKPIFSTNGILTTVAWQVGEKVQYALEGATFIAGAIVQWLRDGLGLIESSAEVEALAASVSDTGGVIVVPALAGLGAPHWRPEARGLISGLTRGTTKAHVARAALEGIAHQIADLISAMEHDAGKKLDSLRVDGGAAANNLLMQFQADLIGAKILRPQMVEATALGAAMLAGLGAKVWPGLGELTQVWQQRARSGEGREFVPSGDGKKIAAARQLWSEAVKRA